MVKNDAESVRVTITLDNEVYDKIKGKAKLSGLHPATWITMVVTSTINRVNGIRIEGDDGECPK